MKKLALISAIVILIVALVGYRFRADISLKINSLKESFGMERIITPDEASKKVKDVVTNNLVKAGTEVAVKSVVKENNLYRATVTIQKKDYVMYLSLDGKKFFPEGMDTGVKPKEEEVAKEIPKTDKPEVDLYVMSFCPYGNKAEDTLKPAYDLLKDKVNFNFHYIVNSDGDTIESLHGAKEVAQNEREACVLKDYGKDKWFEFVTYVNAKCGSDGACWETGAKTLSLDTAKISGCASSDGTALMKTNEQNSTTAGATGSPTMIINGVKTNSVYQYGNSESYKQSICAAFNSVPSECSETLSSSTSTAAGGSCN
jgi:glutaredoxin